jgi:hypothetical protein
MSDRPRLTFARSLRLAPLAVALPMLMGARGDGCAASSRSPAPDVTGVWDITYDDALRITVRIGGAVYTEELGAAGGSFTIDHEGQPLTFDLDCARPEILCPSEAWPETVAIEQRDTAYEHRMIVTLPTQSCEGTLDAPDPESCGAGTSNPACDLVCNGEVAVAGTERFGVIGETGDTFRLYLGAGIATNGLNCALLAASVADAYIGTDGASDTADWRAVSFEDGEVTVAYAGGCLWAGDPDMDGDLEALLVSASIEFNTGFTGTRRDRMPHASSAPAENTNGARDCEAPCALSSRRSRRCRSRGRGPSCGRSGRRARSPAGSASRPTS